MAKRQNLFIALEGIDGSGKSTQTKLLAGRLAGEGHKIYQTFEPTNNAIGSMIREVLRGNVKADDRVVAGMFVADRLDHLLNPEYGVVKKLEEGYTVIMDRYYFIVLDCTVICITIDCSFFRLRMPFLMSV